MTKKLKIKKYKSKIDEFITLLCQGKEIEYIKEQLNIDDDELDDIYSQSLQEFSDRLKAKPNELIYAEYVIDVMKVNRTIDEHIINLQGSKNTKEIAGILKIKLDLAKELHINSRKELGLIKKPTDVISNNIGNINLTIFNNLSNQEKQKELLAFSKDYIKLAKQLGDNPVSILELETGDLHYGESLHDIQDVDVKDDDTIDEDEL